MPKPSRRLVQIGGRRLVRLLWLLLLPLSLPPALVAGCVFILSNTLSPCSRRALWVNRLLLRGMRWPVRVAFYVWYGLSIKETMIYKWV